MFIGFSHHFYVDIDLITFLNRELFDEHFLGDLDIVIMNIIGDLSIHLEENYNMLYIRGVLVPTYTIIFTKDLVGFWQDREVYQRNLYFLLFFFSILAPIEEDWLENYFEEEWILHTQSLEFLLRIYVKLPGHRFM